MTERVFPAATRTTCAYCGVGCGVLATRNETGITIAGDPAHPANAGRLCSKGSALGDTLTGEGRLLQPRIGGRAAGWDQALAAVASRFADTIATHGPDSVAFYVSGQLLTEDYYVANKLMKGFLGSANIDTNSRLCMSSAVAAHQRAFGEDVVPGCYEDLELADLLVLVGSNTAWCHPVLFRRIEEARRRRPSMRVVVIDPRRTATCEGADLHLALDAGSDVVLFNGLLAWLHREGAIDTRFVAANTRALGHALAVAADSAGSVADVARACGLTAADVEAFYRMFAATERVVTAFSQGVNQSSSGTDKATSIVNVHLITGRIGKPGAGPLSLTGQPNAMGGREVGGMANTLAAHFTLEDEGHRRIVQDFWQCPRIAATPGLKAVDLFEALHDGRIKALWIMATNPVVSLPDADRVREALARCEFVVVSDCVASTDTTALADVLLPAAAWGEKDGTTTNSERRISRQRAFVAAPGLAKPDWWIVSQVASRMGFASAFDYASPRQIFAEHARLSATRNHGTRAFDIGGLADLTAAGYDDLEPIQWPVPWAGHPGTARLFGDGVFCHDDGRARIAATAPRPPANACSARFPFVLNSGRIRDQWHTMTRTGVSARLAEHAPEPFVDIASEDAAAAGLADGDLATVTTNWGSARLRVRTGSETKPGNLFVPIHWSDANSSAGRIGALVNPAVDPVSGEPEFKHTPASIEAAPVAWQAVVFGRGLALPPPGASWWARVQGPGFARLEIAGDAMPGDWAGWGRRIFGDEDGPIAEYLDEGSGVYRAFRVSDGLLDACVFVAPRPMLPPRDWIAELFAKDALDGDDRNALLAGRALGAARDRSALVCSCHGVRRRAVVEAVTARGLDSVAAIGRCLGAGTSCGSCVPELGALLASCRRGAEAGAASLPVAGSQDDAAAGSPGVAA